MVLPVPGNGAGTFGAPAFRRARFDSGRARAGREARHDFRAFHIGRQRDAVHVAQPQQGGHVRLVGLRGEGVAQEDDAVHAVARLEQIVRQIDNNELEIDELADKIKEANEIISFCNDKLTKADEEIKKILSEKQESEE